jgi:HAD superfamily hydrolase (TIGR01490 family)
MLSPTPCDGQRAAAFFDLDETLLRVNSGQLYALYERRLGRLSTLAVGVSALCLLLHRFSLLNVEVAYQWAASQFKAREGEQVRAETLGWFEREAAQHMAPGGRPVLARHRERGEPLVLLTNTSAYIAEAACRVWQLDAWLANMMLTDESGRITGRVELPLCIGEGKVQRAEAWARQQGVALEKSSFYSDSISDLPMLERVGHPYVVNPDARLRSHARRRGWPILDWSRP